MPTHPISFRLHPESEPGKIWKQYIDAGYEARQIVEELLLKVGDRPPPPKDDISLQTLHYLGQLVTKLEEAITTARSGVVMVAAPGGDPAVNSFTDEFETNMAESFEPGFRMEDLDE